MLINTGIEVISVIVIMYEFEEFLHLLAKEFLLFKSLKLLVRY